MSKFIVLAEQKYHITSNSITYRGFKLYQIEALKDFGSVKKGDLGGYVQSYDNLDHCGDCWLFDESKCYESGKVSGNANLHQTAEVCGNAQIFGKTHIIDESLVCGHAVIDGDTNIFGGSVVSGHSLVRDSMVCASNISGQTLVSGCHLNDVQTGGVVYLCNTNLRECHLEDTKIYEGFSKSFKNNQSSQVIKNLRETDGLENNQSVKNLRKADDYEETDKNEQLDDFEINVKLKRLGIGYKENVDYRQMLMDLCNELIESNAKWLIPPKIFTWYMQNK